MTTPAARPVCIVGCGLIGQKRAAALPPSLRLAAVHDVDATRATAVAAMGHSNVHVGRDAVDAIASVGAGGLVIVATTHDALAEIARVAVEHDCHVLIEKPGARRRSELEPIAELAARRSVG